MRRSTDALTPKVTGAGSWSSVVSASKDRNIADWCGVCYHKHQYRGYTAQLRHLATTQPRPTKCQVSYEKFGFCTILIIFPFFLVRIALNFNGFLCHYGQWTLWLIMIKTTVMAWKRTIWSKSNSSQVSLSCRQHWMWWCYNMSRHC